MSRRIPTLETERLSIRELTMQDLDNIHQVLNRSFGGESLIEERQRWLQWTVLEYEMFAYLEQPHYWERAIALKESGRIIATTGYDNLASQRVMQKLGMQVQHLDQPQLPDQFVVGVLENDLEPHE